MMRQTIGSVVAWQIPSFANHVKRLTIRGFAHGGHDLRFFGGLSLIYRGRRRQFWLKAAVVKAYPIPKPDVMRADSQHHVSAPDPAKEKRQDAQLLKHQEAATPIR